MAKKPMKAIPADLQQEIDNLKTSLSNAATRVQAIMDKLNTRMSDEDVANLKAELTFVKDTLDAFAPDPINPDPLPPEPTPNP